MKDDQFTKLFTYMQQLDAKLDKSHAELKADIGRVYDLVDKQVENQATDEQERLAMNQQLARHESWIRQLADGTNTNLVVEPENRL